MKHWYRYESTNEDLIANFCKFARRQKFQYESGGPGPRKLFGKPGGAGYIEPRCPVYYITAFLDENELAKANAWLQTH